MLTSPRLHVFVDQLEVHVFERVPPLTIETTSAPARRAPGSARARRRAGQTPSARSRRRRRECQPSTPGTSGEHALGGIQRSDRGDRQRAREQRSRSSSGGPRSAASCSGSRRVAHPLASRGGGSSGRSSHHARAARRSDRHSREATGSRPEVGSSRNRTRGSLSSARAIATRCLRPFDRLLQGSSARSARLTVARACSIRGRTSARP